MGEMTLGEAVRPIEEALAAGHHDQARARCLALLEQMPRALRAQRLLGEISLAQGLIAESNQLFRRVLRANPEDALALIGLALIHERRNEQSAALACYQWVCELRPGNSQVLLEYNRLAYLLRRPAFQLSRAGLARLYMRGGLWNRALWEWRAVLKRSPDRLDAQVGLIEVLWWQKQWPAAEASCREILQGAEQCLKALLILGAILALDGRAVEAWQFLRPAVALDPDLGMARALCTRLTPEEREAVFEALRHARTYTPLPDATMPLATASVEAPAIESLPTVIVPMVRPPVTKRGDSAVASSGACERPAAARHGAPPPSLSDSPALTDNAAGEPRLPAITRVIPGQRLILPARSLSSSNHDESAPAPSALRPEPAPTVMGSGYSLPVGGVPSQHNGAHAQRTPGAEAADSDYRARLAQATHLRLRGQLSEALILYQEILRFAPDLITQVISELQAIADNTPERGPVYHLLGDAYLRQGNYLQALEAYNQGLALVRQSSGRLSVIKNT